MLSFGYRLCDDHCALRLLDDAETLFIRAKTAGPTLISRTDRLGDGESTNSGSYRRILGGPV
jgi:hypothetical protein